ncbi:MAG TPA: NAD-dependent epimerase/dehydratase family protein [Candidatus Limnocylindrales bacterium]|nr:NAD-dependent epimerase/dehydratase family protein [Candidatus Limnocylindrales bacterium]
MSVGRVLVTGGAGFIGSALVRRLAASGIAVRVLDDLSIGRRAYLDGQPCELLVGTLTDPEAVATAVAGCDAVVHLAARAGIPDSVTDPLGTFEANVTHTVRMLDAARIAGARRFVLASSNAVLGPHVPPADETVLPRPSSPYGASKLAGEGYVTAYADTYGMAACALRFSNAYGPRSLHKKSVVAAWIRAGLAGAPLTIHGDGEQTRDFVHVDDLAGAILAALRAPEDRVAGAVLQVGTGRETTVNELAATLERAMGHPLSVERGPVRPGDVSRNSSRVDRAAELLGWRSQVELLEGLQETAAWFEAALATPALAGVVPDSRSGSE